ncbi:MAG: tetratricopeptide repeat protein, partial [Candidatus Binatia bacterium]
QVYSFSVEDYALVVRTLASVFPYVRLVRISEGDTILLASESPLDPEKETVLAAQALVDSVPEVRSDLMTHFGTAEVVELLAAHLLLDREGIARLLGSSASSTINDDRNLRLEFDAPKSLFRPVVDPSQDVMRVILAAVDPLALDRDFGASGGESRHAGVFHRLANVLLTRGLADAASEVVDLGLARNPREKDLLGDKLVLSEVDPATFESIVSEIVTLSEEHATAVGVTLWSRQKYAQAKAIFQRLLALHPHSATAWNNLALTQQSLGESEQALESFRKALSLDPLNDAPRKSYEALLQRSASRPGG